MTTKCTVLFWVLGRQSVEQDRKLYTRAAKPTGKEMYSKYQKKYSQARERMCLGVWGWGRVL